MVVGSSRVWEVGSFFRLFVFVMYGFCLCEREGDVG